LSAYGIDSLRSIPNMAHTLLGGYTYNNAKKRLSLYYLYKYIFH
jgi:hypothetical protein